MQIRNFNRNGRNAIAKIRAANDALPGEKISGKLNKLEFTCERIFDYVAAHPETLPQTRKLMNYYLPITLKLVEKYQQYEEMGYELASVQKSKLEIETSLDIINEAFYNLLQSLRPKKP